MELEMPILECKHLFLRPVELADASDLFEIYGDDRVMYKHTSMHTYKSIDDMVVVLRTYFLAYKQRCLPQSMVLECKETGKVIGLIEFHTIKYDCGELGYLLAHSYWNQGYMREAIAGMLYLGFTYLNLHRIEAYYDPENLASAQVLKHNRFVCEGMLRKLCKLNDDAYHDLVVCGILKEEFDVANAIRNYEFSIGGNET